MRCGWRRSRPSTKSIWPILPVEKIVVAGEPGGSVPAIRERIERAWDARVVDHAGATEVGPWGFADAEGRGLHVNESEFIAEFMSVETGRAGQRGRARALGPHVARPRRCPVIRYRTGDLVRPTWPTQQGRTASCCWKAACWAGPTT